MSWQSYQGRMERTDVAEFHAGHAWDAAYRRGEDASLARTQFENQVERAEARYPDRHEERDDDDPSRPPASRDEPGPWMAQMRAINQRGLARAELARAQREARGKEERQR